MTVIEELQAKKAALQAEMDKVEAEIAAIPSEFHTFEAEAWARIKAFFHANPAAAAPTPPTTPPTVPPAA